MGAAAGLPILLLMPAWLAGVAVWRWHCRAAPSVPRTAGLALAILPIVALIALKLADIDGTLLAATGRVLGPGDPWSVLGYAREAAWNLVIAACLALHLVGMRAAAPTLPRAAARAVRWIAGASFSIYVVHYPVLHLLDAVLPEDVPAKAAVVVLVPLAACLLFAQVFERPLSRLRRWLVVQHVLVCRPDHAGERSRLARPLDLRNHRGPGSEGK